MSVRDEILALKGKTPTAQTLAALGDLARRAEGDVWASALARSMEAHHARWIDRHQHAVVVGAELLELWPAVRALGLDREEDDLPFRFVWGLKYVAGSAMDIPEIPLATTDELIGVVAETLDHWGYEKNALWALQGRRAYIAGDDVQGLIAKLVPVATRYHHVYHNSDCPGCLLLSFAHWLGPDASDADVEEVLAPLLGRRPLPPDPPQYRAFMEKHYGAPKPCISAERGAPIKLSRTYTRAGRLAEGLREAERALAMIGDNGPEQQLRAHVARAAVAIAMQAPDAPERAREIVAKAGTIEDPYDALDTILVGYRVLEDASLVQRALGLAERLDARIEKKRHVAATRAALEA